MNHLLITVYIYFLTTIILDNIKPSSKFYPVLCVEHEILIINFASREILKSIFL